MTEQEIKYKAFVELDEATNLGRIVNGCNEFRYLLDHPSVNAIFAKHYENDLLTYATTFSAFYKKYAGFKSLRDFPIMTKADLKAHWDEIAVHEFADDPNICTKYTSGATGTPFKMIVDKYRHARWIGANKVFRDMCGMKSHDKQIFISETVKDKNIPLERMERDNVYYYSMPYLDETAVKTLINKLISEDFHAMTSLASNYDKIARLVVEGKVPEWTGHFVAAFSVSEPLKETTRKIISEYFKCPLYVVYGNEENGAFGAEDGSGLGCRLNNVDFTIEVLKMDSDEPVEDGEIGRLVITDYFNKAFPLIRYENGDLISLNHLEDGRIYISEILGRLADTLYTTDGRMVHYFDGISFMEEFMDIQQFQLIQEDYHHFKWILNTKNHSYENLIIEHSKRLFGEDSEWIIEYVDEIPKLRSGKQRMTVCNIKEKTKQ